MKYGKLVGFEAAVPCLAVVCLVSLTLLDQVLLEPSIKRAVVPLHSEDSSQAIRDKTTNLVSAASNHVHINTTLRWYRLQMTTNRVKQLSMSTRDDVDIFQKPLKGFPSDCKCQSLFSLEPCYFQHIEHLSTTNSALKQAIMNVRAAMTGAPISLNANLEVMDTLLTDTNNMKLGKPVSNNLFSFSSPDLVPDLPKHIAKGMTVHLPSMPCNTYNFSSDQIAKCLQVREDDISRKLKVAFIGDSQVRNLLENIVGFLKQRLNLTISEPKGMNIDADFLGKKIKKNLSIFGTHLVLELYWSMYINENSLRQHYSGPKRLFNSWIQDAMQGTKNVPEIVIVDTGLWELKNKSEVHAIEDILCDIKDMKHLLGELSKITQVLWRPIGPLKEWLATHQVPNAALDIMNQATRMALRGTAVWFWDTALLQALREVRRCRRRGRAHEGEDCGDFMHPSQQGTETLLANMLWNLVCNKVMREPPSACCS